MKRNRQQWGGASCHRSSRPGLWLMAGSLLAVIGSTAASAAEPYLVFFNQDSAGIAPTARAVVEQVIEEAKADGVDRILIRGYAGQEEDDASELGEQRAKAVAAAVRKLRGAGMTTVEAEAGGISDSPASEFTPEMDRRVEIVFDRREPSYGAVSGGSILATVR
jgi:outer membrane protein OmpA-like peptidoglycan-associated protein